MLMLPAQGVSKTPSLNGRRIVVGVTGGIAAYKAADFVSALVQRGADVRVVMTRAARELVGPATFRSLTGHDVALELFEPVIDTTHVALACFGEVLAVVPATANFLAKAAHGIADDLLTTNVLAFRGPVLVAPAMNWRMWGNVAVQENVEKLRQRGVIIVEPEEGFLACGETGRGRLARLDTLLAAVRYALRRADLQDKPSPLTGRRVLITAGPTREYLDPVRFLSNASTGAMGFALAAEAIARGAKVSVVHGPTYLAPPPDIHAVPVTTAAEMAEAVFAALDETDIFIGAAAVADYTPAAPADQKQPKSAAPLEVRLLPTIDIIAEVRKRRPDAVIVGFAAETHDAEARAREKLRRKKMDIVVANEVGRDKGFGPGETQLTILSADGPIRQTGPMAKDDAASLVVDAIEDLLRARCGEGG